ncbi:MAG: hypothetical protein JXQ29_11450 [Planctomycetes bacterium]|nr:hypothetical protein [Planctomycetota bacterium]
MRQAIGAFLILSVLAGIALLPALLGDRVLFPRDARSVVPWQFHADGALREALARERVNDVLTDKNVFDFPKLHLAYRLWQEEGKVPLWNPDTFCGNPLVASAMPSPLYPGNLFFLLDPYRGFTWAAFLHLVLSGYGLFLYLRALGLRATAALLGGTTYAFSGWFLVHLYLPSYLYAATWFPVMLLAAERLMRGGRLLWVAVLAGAVALSALAGFPPVTVYALYATAIYVAFRLVAAWRSGGIGTLVLRPPAVLLGAVLGLGLAAFQIAPMLELKQHSGRGHLDVAELRAGALRPLGLLGLALPDFFGNPVDQGPPLDTGRRTGPLLPRKLGLDGPPPPEDWGNNYLENTLYLGVLPLLLALIALVRRPRPVTWFWTALGALALWMSLGPALLEPIYEHVPFLRIGSLKRFLFLFTAAGAILAGIGFDGAIGVGRLRRRWGVLPYVPLLLLAAGAGPLLLVPELLKNLLGELAKLTPLSAYALPEDELAAWTRNTRWCILRAGAVLLPASAIYFLIRRGHAARPLRFGVLLLTFLDLAWLGYRFNPVHRPDQMAPTPGIEFLAERAGEPPFRVARYGRDAHFALPPNTGMIYRIQDIQGWDVLFPARYQRFMNLIEPGVGAAHHLIGPFRDHRSLSHPLIDLLGVRFVLTHDDWGPNPAQGFVPAYPLDPAGGFLKERVAREGLVIYENTECLPRAFLAAAAVHVPGGDAAFEALAAPGFDPLATVILEGGAPPGAERPLDASAPVRVTGYRSRHVTVEVGAGGPAVLVLADAFDPGWSAALADGSALKIRRADAIFRAVELPARDGPVAIHFHYAGDSFRKGSYVAAASAVLLLVGLLAWLLMRAGVAQRRHPPEG